MSGNEKRKVSSLRDLPREIAPPQCWKPTVVERSGCGSSPVTITSMRSGLIFFT